MIKFLSQLLDLIYKKRCYFCKSTKENSKLCSDCFEKINFLPLKPVKYIESKEAYSAVVYKKDIQRLICGLKYHDQKELAFYQAKVMYEYWQRLEVSKDNFTIVPVPLFKKRERKRRYNHMLLVAEEFAKMTGYSVNNCLIKRIKDTKPQFKLSMKERKANLSKAFETAKENYCGGKLLILDDILTTGSTLSEMVKALQIQGITDVTLFVTSCTEYNLN